VGSGRYRHVNYIINNITNYNMLILAISDLAITTAKLLVPNRTLKHGKTCHVSGHADSLRLFCH